tara:strand:+ start:7117 stop:7275 length:159 start_codon:yes stop_codon:yes gene_type:complete
MASNPNNANPDIAPDESVELQLTLMERWGTKQTLVTVGLVVLLYFAYKKLKK